MEPLLPRRRGRRGEPAPLRDVRRRGDAHGGGPPACTSASVHPQEQSRLQRARRAGCDQHDRARAGVRDDAQAHARHRRGVDRAPRGARSAAHARGRGVGGAGPGLRQGARSRAGGPADHAADPRRRDRRRGAAAARAHGHDRGGPGRGDRQARGDAPGPRRDFRRRHAPADRRHRRRCRGARAGRPAAAQGAEVVGGVRRGRQPDEGSAGLRAGSGRRRERDRAGRDRRQRARGRVGRAGGPAGARGAVGPARRGHHGAARGEEHALVGPGAELQSGDPLARRAVGSGRRAGHRLAARCRADDVSAAHDERRGVPGPRGRRGARAGRRGDGRRPAADDRHGQHRAVDVAAPRSRRRAGGRARLRGRRPGRRRGGGRARRRDHQPRRGSARRARSLRRALPRAARPGARHRHA